jgi:hypothetical protein
MKVTRAGPLASNQKSDGPRPAWLLFLLTMQGQQGALRMRLWRTLKALGTAVLRDGAYLLPNRPALLESLHALEQDVSAAEGSVQLLELDARDAKQQREFEALFDRTADYQKLLGEIRETRKKLAAMDAGAIGTAAGRLRRDLENLVAADYFPARASVQATLALDDFLADTTAILSPDEPRSVRAQIQRLDTSKYRSRIWATRAHPWVDRLASAWLIRRFIDPEARLLWLKNPKDCPKRALGFDFDGAAFTHVGGKVTFEVLMESFGLDSDPRLQRVAALIHYLDVGGIPVPEAAGIESLLRAARATFADDDILLGEAERIFELIYISYGEADNPA